MSNCCEKMTEKKLIRWICRVFFVSLIECRGKSVHMKWICFFSQLNCANAKQSVCCKHDHRKSMTESSGQKTKHWNSLQFSHTTHIHHRVTISIQTITTSMYRSNRYSCIRYWSFISNVTWQSQSSWIVTCVTNDSFTLTLDLRWSKCIWSFHFESKLEAGVWMDINTFSWYLRNDLIRKF